MIREMVTIDEELCDGCGLCVPSCEEGALRIIDGKARLMADRLCDGMGACLGHCPRGAIKIERREADAFDDAAVQAHLRGGSAPGPRSPTPTVSPMQRPSHFQGDHAATAMPVLNAPVMSGSAPAAPAHGGCPGSQSLRFQQSPPAPAAGASATPSQLRHWPVQLRLLSPQAPALQGAKLLVCADCVPFACSDFHQTLMAGHAVAVACPKLDDPRGYVEKLAAIMQHNALPKITVARMEVPCCMGLVAMVMQARELAGADVPVEEIVVGVQGEICARRQL